MHVIVNLKGIIVPTATFGVVCCKHYIPACAVAPRIGPNFELFPSIVQR